MTAPSVKRPEVVLEFDAPEGWRRLGSVSDAEPPGSISSDGPPRQVYLFGWLDGSPGVWRSVAGIDVETPAIREVSTLGLERLADLSDGDAVELIIRRRDRTTTLLVRFRLEP
jgi:hypothetical protein